MGLGKTHLMHAIGNAVLARYPRKRVVYATSEKFTNEFITSIQQGRIDEFRNRYRRIDLLLIDDIQFIADKERTQEEFFHTFNAIHEDGKQIVLSSDRPPKQIVTLEERLRSRFEWGLIADLTAPDLETRIAILRAKAEEMGVPLSADVVEFIARKVVSNIRELEGALNRIVAYASMQGQPIDIALAQAVLSNVLFNPKKRQVTPERIARAVSEYYGVGMDQLKGQKRDKAIVVPRQIAMYLMRAETDVSLIRIGDGARRAATTRPCCTRATRSTARRRRTTRCAATSRPSGRSSTPTDAAARRRPLRPRPPASRARAARSRPCRAAVDVRLRPEHAHTGPESWIRSGERWITGVRLWTRAASVRPRARVAAPGTPSFAAVHRSVRRSTTPSGRRPQQVGGRRQSAAARPSVAVHTFPRAYDGDGDVLKDGKIDTDRPDRPESGSADRLSVA